MLVLHKCDNRKCVNPDHLFLGTPQDNMDDMVRKSRSLKGSKHPGAKLTDGDVATVFRLRSEGLSQRAIGEKFGVCQSNISHILNGLSWKHKIITRRA